MGDPDRSAAENQGIDSNATILPVILNGKFFTVTSREGNKVSAACNLCPKAIHKTINGHINSTTNFREHLKVIS